MFGTVGRQVAQSVALSRFSEILVRDFANGDLTGAMFAVSGLNHSARQG